MNRKVVTLLCIVASIVQVRCIDVYIDDFGEVVENFPGIGRYYYWPDPNSQQTGDGSMCSDTLDVIALSHNNIYIKEGWFHWETDMVRGKIATSISLYNVNEFVSYGFLNGLWSVNDCHAINANFYTMIQTIQNDFYPVMAATVSFDNYDTWTYRISENGITIVLLCKPLGSNTFIPCTNRLFQQIAINKIE